ncbi:MAG: heavy metal translocating P-type ATPase [Chloroflexota bacterium]
MHQVEKKLNQDLTMTMSSLVFAGTGLLLYTPLIYLSLPGLFWMAYRAYEDVLISFRKMQGQAMAILCAIFMTGAIATGSYFAAALGTGFYRISRKLLSRTEDYSKNSLINVFGNQKRSAWLVKDDIEIEVPIENLKCGDIIVVGAGDVVPVDGKICSGRASIDQHILTGESQPLEKEIGDNVLASTMVLSGKILIEVSQTGEETVAAQIGEILNQTADFKTSIQSWGEVISERSAKATLLLSLLLFPLAGATTALTVLSVGFGTYMTILGPLSMLSFLNLASRQGILVKDGRSLQLLTEVDTIVFDKTGTLTKEEPHVSNIYVCEEMTACELLMYAAAAEHKQSHPIAKAIRKKANEQNLARLAIHTAEYEIGYGLKVTVEEPPVKTDIDTIANVSVASTKVVCVGSRRFMDIEQITVPACIAVQHQKSLSMGNSFVYVAVDHKLIGAIELQPTIRDEAAYVVRSLQECNISTMIISGDNESPTRQLANRLGIDRYFAETLPSNKAELIRQLQAEGRSVCFVGDGINDSIALKQANVSISICGASSAATDTAQVVLMNQNLNQILHLLDIAKRFEKNMKFNLASTVMPGFMGLYGAFFLHFGILHAVSLNAAGAIVGASNIVWPWLTGQQVNKSISYQYLNMEVNINENEYKTI